jgi:DNA-binding NarL/FixJ family response regulator
MLPSAEINFKIVGQTTPEVERVIELMRGYVAESLTGSMTDPPGQSGPWGSTIRQWMDWSQPSTLNVFGSYHRSTHLRASEYHLDVVVVNALPGKRRITPRRIGELVHSARQQEPHGPVLVLLDEGSPEAVRAAHEAGAYEFVGRDQMQNIEALRWRVLNAVLLAWIGIDSQRTPVPQPLEPKPITTRESARLTKAEIEQADMVIDAAVAGLPSPAERRAGATGLFEIVAPHLRNAETGRLDARKISEATGLSLAALARASSVSQQALSSKPDSQAAQDGLLPIARVSEMLDELFAPEHKRIWLQTPHARFGGRSPVQAMEHGDAELVALSVGGALEGLPD